MTMAVQWHFEYARWHINIYEIHQKKLLMWESAKKGAECAWVLEEWNGIFFSYPSWYKDGLFYATGGDGAALASSFSQQTSEATDDKRGRCSTAIELSISILRDSHCRSCSHRMLNLNWYCTACCIPITFSWLTLLWKYWSFISYETFTIRSIYEYMRLKAVVSAHYSIFSV